MSRPGGHAYDSAPYHMTCLPMYSCDAHQLQQDTYRSSNDTPDTYRSSNDTPDALLPSPQVLHAGLYDDFEDLSCRRRPTSHEFDRYYPSDTSHSGNSFIDSSSSLSHDSRHASSLHTNFSRAYSQRLGAGAYGHELTDRSEISLLKKDKYDLEQKIDKFQQQIVSLQQQVASLEALCMGNFSSASPHSGDNNNVAPDSFNEMLKMAREASTLIPALDREDYEGVYYWDKDEWTKEYHGGRGVLKVKRTEDAGSALYLVDEDGVVASVAVQQKIRDRLHTLWFTLLKHGRAPTSWTKIDIQALEFVCLSM
ncbi:uncharacterized protein EDB93DRAFT_1252912 [Suillus bovinus]|uniref:uncharacterized protein n=1 Tax=Suillus bovinus TaxID=48563 RepID=UPI001B878AA6|nr:uncharacterized protein EDB93DRAFT_1252912 [Suillus bovinus]KAG2140273.1 hypothetical protein EDB93DRAFT_1252912 [Suillus bovinus]